jgi:mono/diheme cytochrome c family protein
MLATVFAFLFLRTSFLRAQEKEQIALSAPEMNTASGIFAGKCAVCHGADGEGFDLRTNLTDDIWNHGARLTDIERTIREGVPGTMMRPQGDALKGAEIALLAKYVKLFGQRSHANVEAPAGGEASKLTDRVAAQLPASGKGKALEQPNLIDEYIFGKMKTDRIPHAELSTDTEFMRRVYLDLWGRLPDTDVTKPIELVDLQVSLPNRYTVQKFIADSDPEKRNKLIDHLLGLDYADMPVEDDTTDRKGPWLVERPFVSKWTLFFEDFFRSGEKVFNEYVYDVVKYNVPYDYVVRDMLTVSSLFRLTSGPANFLLKYEVPGVRDTDTMHEDTCDEIAIGATKLFAGVNLECVSCHDGARHLEKINVWLSKRKRVDLWRQAAFFGNLRIGRPGQDTNLMLIDGPPAPLAGAWKEEVPNFTFTSPPTTFGGPGYRVEAPSVLRPPRDKNASVYPEFILNKERPVSGVNPRTEFARLLTSDPQFAKVAVNLIWSKLMTVGIVDPPFDWDLDRQDSKNPPPAPWTVQPSHPELLDALGRDFQQHQYDLRYLMRLICRSKAYQLSSRFDGNYKPEYDRYYARKLVRRLSAEEIYDAIAKATNVFGHGVTFVMDQNGTPDLELSRFLDLFGRSNRSTRQPSAEGSLLQASLLLNSDLVKKKVLAATKGSRVGTLLSKTPPLSNKQLVQELYLATLSRYPTDGELQKAVAHVERYRDKGVEDLQWALINSLEFMVNH